MSCSSSAIHGTSTTTTTTSTTTTTTETDPKKFKGVRRRKWGKWVSEIRVPRTAERLWLGTYATPEAAAVAHDVAVYCLRRPSSLEKLNFPETLSSYYCVQQQMTGDMSPRSVQKVASDAGMAVDAHNIAAAVAGKTSSSSLSSSSIATTQTTPYDQKENNSDDDRRRHSNNNGVDPDHSHDAFWWEGLRYGCGATWQGSEDCREGEDLSISVEDYL